MKSISVTKKCFTGLLILFVLFQLNSCTQEVEKTSEITKMSNDQISLAVIIKAKVENEEEVKNACIGLLEPTRKEKGCINYMLHTDPNDKSRFMFYENWENKELWEAHLNASHIKEFGEKTKDLFAEPLDVIFLFLRCTFIAVNFRIKL